MKFLFFILIIFVRIKILFGDSSYLSQNKILQILPGNDNFDIFKYSSKLNNDTLLIYELTNLALNNLIGKNSKNQIVDKYKLYNFLLYLADEYNSNTFPNKNPYHNLFHASDVVHTLYIYLLKSKKSNPILFFDTYIKQGEELEFISNINYNELDIFALIIAAACHDFRHTGRDNNFYSNYRDKVPFAKILKYYDYKLELYHFDEAKKLIDEFGILENLNKFQKERFYKIMKISIYGTDNSLNKKHSEDLLKYKDIMTIKSINLTNETLDEVKLIMFECLLHGADISNPTKSKDLMLTWSNKVNEEFCEQSNEIHSLDETKEIYCVGNDNKKFKESQLSFFINIVEVFFKPFCEVFNSLNYLCENYENNKLFLENLK